MAGKHVLSTVPFAPVDRRVIRAAQRATKRGSDSDYIAKVIEAVIDSLGFELLKKKYQDTLAVEPNLHRTFGHCYAASEAVWYLLGKTHLGYRPHVLRIPGGTHWFLKHKLTGKVLDVTGEQFRRPVLYENAICKGFLTGRASKRAAIIMERARKRLSGRTKERTRHVSIH